MHYLTGFDHPDAFALLSNIPGKHEFSLAVQPHNEREELWNGPRPGTDGAIADFGADHAFSNSDLAAELTAALVGCRNLFLVAAGAEDSLNIPNEVAVRRVKRIARAARPGLRIRDGKPFLHELRLEKTPFELALLQRACDVTEAAHRSAMKNGAALFQALKSAGQILHEGQIQAFLDKEYRNGGAPRSSFASIVASGASACTLHYVENSGPVSDGDLILVDSGAEYGGFAGDVTRTWPINGLFKPAQRQIHDLVCAAQEAAIKTVAPGTSLKAVHGAAFDKITEGLKQLGILQKDAGCEATKDFFPHGTSHFLGMDVHDVAGKTPSSSKERPLVPGNVITIEPGIYISPTVVQKYNLPPKWWNIGVRIEDDIVVTESGHLNLTGGIPKSSSEIEAFLSEHS